MRCGRCTDFSVVSCGSLLTTRGVAWLLLTLECPRWAQKSGKMFTNILDNRGTTMCYPRCAIRGVYPLGWGLDP